MRTTISLLVYLFAMAPVFAQPMGPRGPMGPMGCYGYVMEKCAAEIEEFCDGVEHMRGQVRICLEEHRDELSQQCKQALDTSGPGRGRGCGGCPNCGRGQ